MVVEGKRTKEKELRSCATHKKRILMKKSESKSAKVLKRVRKRVIKRVKKRARKETR